MKPSLSSVPMPSVAEQTARKCITLSALPGLIETPHISATSSRSRSSRSAIALIRAFACELGLAFGKKAVIGTPKNSDTLSEPRDAD
jgi:hypothetical protein